MGVKCINCRNKKTYTADSGRSIDFCYQGYWDREDEQQEWLHDDNDFADFTNIEKRFCSGYEALDSNTKDVILCDVSTILNTLCTFSNGAYAPLFNVVKFKEICISCAFFNLSLPSTQQYRCRTPPNCIAATLHPDIIKTFNKVLGWCGAI